VNGGSHDLALAQLQSHLVCPVLGAGEDQYPAHILLFKEILQQSVLVDLIHKEDALIYPIQGALLRPGINPHCIVQQLAGKLVRLPVWRGGEE